MHIAPQSAADLYDDLKGFDHGDGCLFTLSTLNPLFGAKETKKKGYRKRNSFSQIPINWALPAMEDMEVLFGKYEPKSGSFYGYKNDEKYYLVSVESYSVAPLGLYFEDKYGMEYEDKYGMEYECDEDGENGEDDKFPLHHKKKRHHQWAWGDLRKWR